MEHTLFITSIVTVIEKQNSSCLVELAM